MLGGLEIMRYCPANKPVFCQEARPVKRIFECKTYRPFMQLAEAQQATHGAPALCAESTDRPTELVPGGVVNAI